MKRILTLTVAFIAVFSLASCNDCEECDAIDSVFQVRPESVIFGSDAGEPQIIDVITSSDVSWEAEVDAAAQDWLTITTEADKIIVSVAENATGKQRTGKIFITPDNGSFKAKEIAVVQYSVKVTSINVTGAVLVFWGEYYKSGLGYYTINLGSGDVRFDEYGQMLVYEGYYIIFGLLAQKNIPEDFQREEIQLKEGIYRSDTKPDDAEYKEMSFFTTYLVEYIGILEIGGSVIMKLQDGELKNIFISEGEITVTNKNGDYTINVDLTASDGEKFLINYSGRFNSKYDNGALSTYKTDVNIINLDIGSLEFHGETQDCPDGYKWIIRIPTPGYDNISEIMMSVYSTTTNKTILEDGIYNITDIYPYAPFTAEQGRYDWLYDEYKAWMELIGCVLFGYTDDELTDYGPLIDGTVTVTHNGGDNYTIEMDAIMDNYYPVKVSFEGDLEYVDKTETQP